MTASFLKELLRRSAVIAAAADGSGEINVSADDLDAALDELLDTRNAMTRVLLGGAVSGGGSGGAAVGGVSGFSAAPGPGLAPRQSGLTTDL